MTFKKYSVIYADPPWKYNSCRAKYISNNCGETQKHYPTMTYDQLKQLCVKDIADDNCMLFMWVTFPQLQQGLNLIRDWGFNYKTVAFTWFKSTKNQQPCFGIGYYTRSNAEICLLGIKGHPIKNSSNISSVIIAPRQNHSKKPDIVRNKIVDLCGNVNKIELFARAKTDGWDIFGNELESDVDLNDIKRS